MIYMFPSNNPLSGDINSSNLSCFARIYLLDSLDPDQARQFVKNSK